MPQSIEFGGWRHEFPDDFTTEDIRKALASTSTVAPHPSAFGNVNPNQSGAPVFPGIEGAPPSVTKHISDPLGSGPMPQNDAPAEATASNRTFVPPAHRATGDARGAWIDSGLDVGTGLLSFLGAIGGGAIGGPPGAIAGSGAGAAEGSMLSDMARAKMGTPRAPDQKQFAWNAGVNLGVGAGAQALSYVPGLLARAAATRIGEASYKAALHVPPAIRDEFPGIDVAQEAWNRGAPRLNAEGVRQAEESIGRAARPVRARMDLANSRSRLGSIWSERAVDVPATVPRDLTFELPMTDPQAGASPTVTRRAVRGIVPQGAAQERAPVLSGPAASPPPYSPFPMEPAAPGALPPPEGPYSPLPMDPVRPPSLPGPAEGFPNLEHGPNSTVWRDFQQVSGTEEVPRTVLPIEPQTVTHRVYVPGTVTERGLVQSPKFLAKITPSAADLLARDADGRLVNAPGLQRLIEGVRGNLAGHADAGEVNAILEDWLQANGSTKKLSDLYTLGQKAGAAGDWRAAGDVGGETARMAASPNFRLTGRELKLAINNYIDEQMKKAGVSGFRAGNAEVQKTIAVRDAVREAGKVGPPRLNAENAAAQAKWGAFRNPETLGDFGRWAGGKTTELPKSKIARAVIGAARGAVRIAGGAPQTANVLVRPLALRNARGNGSGLGAPRDTVERDSTAARIVRATAPRPDSASKPEAPRPTADLDPRQPYVLDTNYEDRSLLLDTRGDNGEHLTGDQAFDRWKKTGRGGQLMGKIEHKRRGQ